MKRIVSLVLCMALAIGAVTYKPPQAKALVVEFTTAQIICSLVGLSLVSLGFSWMFDNYQSSVADSPVTKFGSNLADDLQDWLNEEHEGKVIDVFFGDMMPNLSPTPGSNGGVVVLASAAFIGAVSAFGKWLYDKYALSENESVVVSGSGRSLLLDDGSYFLVSTWLSSDSEPSYTGTTCKIGETYTFSTGMKLQTLSSNKVIVYKPNGDVAASISSSGKEYAFICWNGLEYRLAAYGNNDYSLNHIDLTQYLTPIVDPSLSVSAPNGLNLPDTEELPDGQGFALEFPDITADDFPELLEVAVPEILTNPEYVPVLSPVEVPEVDPSPTPDPTPSDEEVPDPAPEGATIIDYLVDIWRKIKALPETIGNAIKSAFEPDPELVTEITTTFTNKFGWLETIHRFGQDLFGMTADTAPPVIYIHLEDAEGKYNYGGLEKVLDMSWYQRYKADVDNILSGFMWIAFLWLVFKRASAIIQGGEMITEYTNDLDQGHR